MHEVTSGRAAPVQRSGADSLSPVASAARSRGIILLTALACALGLDLSLGREPLGPCSRKTPLVISEIMYKPAPRPDTNNLEYIEVYNSNPWFQDLSGYRLVGGSMDYTFPDGTRLAGGGFLVVAASPSSIEAVYGVAKVMGPYRGSLKKSDTIRLLDEQGAVLLQVPYDSNAPWPVAADGTGHSLELASPSFGEGSPRAWDISDQVGGSPGHMDVVHPSPLRRIVINEFLAHHDPSDPGYVELYNPSDQPIDVSGCVLTDDPSLSKCVITAGAMVPAGGHRSFTETDLHFVLNPQGQTLYFLNPDRSRVLDAVQFGGQEKGVATGRWPDGASQFYRLSAPTPGGANAAILLGEVVINELMYHSPGGDDEVQYVELYNRSPHPVDLGGWQLGATIAFTFQPRTVLAADGYLVVGRDLARLRANYANLTSANAVGNFSGHLPHKGGRVSLKAPGALVTTNSFGLAVTNWLQITVNEVTYESGGRWGQWSAGGGSSLELLDPNSNTRLAANWADSDESQKAPWTNIEVTGILDHGRNLEPGITFAQLGLLDAGECLVDEVEVRAGGEGPNLVVNPGFENGLSGWSLQGDHVRSTLEETGYASAHSLHIRCSERLWTGANSCQIPLGTNSLAEGQVATLRFKARWLRGWPEALLRLSGNWLEASGSMPVPKNLGTPGARNSRHAGNAGPALYEVTHTPSLPAVNQVVTVTGRAHDSDGGIALTLNYRVDPEPAYTGVPMKDDGTGGDAMAGDGLYSATIPGQTSNTLVAFFISATDSRGAVTRFPALLDNNAPARECAVLWGDIDPVSSFGVYHLWITRTNVTRWSELPNLSNESCDCTFVSGTRVIYNAEARFAGSPYHQIYDSPDGHLCHYTLTLPEDDRFLGTTSFSKLHQPGNTPGDDPSLQREQLANSFLRALGVPWLNRRYVVVLVNGNRRGGLMEDAQCPDGDVVRQYFPNDEDGWLYKMQPWYEFGPFPMGTVMPFNDTFNVCTIMPYTTTGGAKKTARYRYTYLARRTPGSASDFTNVFSLVDAASTHGTPGYVANLENLADMENWMRVFAANRAAGNWDVFGSQVDGGNLYGYIGSKGTRYSLLMHDFNICFGNSSWGPGENLFVPGGMDPNLDRIYSEPAFRRMYWRALQELVNGPLDVANSGPMLDAKYHAFTEDNLNVEDPDLRIKPWLSQARASIARQLADENTDSFAVVSTVVGDNNVAQVSGTAPVSVKAIWFNGVEYPVSWTTVTNWTVTLPLNVGTNAFKVVGVDRHNLPVAGASNNVVLVYGGTLVSPTGQVVINEIMYAPTLPGAQYVELFNASSEQGFDLSGWCFRGLSYTFPPGAFIPPGGYLVLAANRAAFAAAYGVTNRVFDVFTGKLQAEGETLTLVKPGSAEEADQVVARVRYGNTLPWPEVAATRGVALQLIDPRQDNWRPGNWYASPPDLAGFRSASPGFTNRWCGPLTAFPTLWINEVQAENWSGPTNRVGQRAGWIEIYNPGPIAVSLDNLFLANNYTNLTQWAFPSNVLIPAGTFEVIFADGQAELSTPDEFHTSFVLGAGAGSLALTRLTTNANAQLQVLDYLDYTSLRPDHSFGSRPDGQSFTRQEFYHSTPGRTNDGAAAPVSVCINEWMAGNTRTLRNPIDGKYGDWFELFNYGSKEVDLSGYFLTHSPTNAFEFLIPAGYVLPPQGFLLVWADKLSATNCADLHVNFKLSKSGGSIGLCDANGNPVDYVSFGPQTSDVSLGRYPDGSTSFSLMPGSPGANNLINHPPVLASITDRRILLGQTLSLNVEATDADAPAQLLTFSLDSGTPPGVLLGSDAGLLVWTPTNAPSSNQVGVIVWDNGVPSLRATQTFGVTVLLPAPAPQPVVSGTLGGTITLSWASVLGRTYRIESSDELASGRWVQVGPDRIGTGAELSLPVAINDSVRRFYRIALLP